MDGQIVMTEENALDKYLLDKAEKRDRASRSYSDITRGRLYEYSMIAFFVNIVNKIALR